MAQFNPQVVAVAVDALTIAHSPALGEDRSVNEAWCRADQTKRISEFLRSVARTSPAAHKDQVLFIADAVLREFGGGSR